MARFNASQHWRSSIVSTAAALLLSPLAVRADTALPPGVPKEVCATHEPRALLDGAEPAAHSYSALPHHRSIETATFKGGVRLRIEQSGCAGPAASQFTFAFPAPGAGKREIDTLVDFLDAHEDVLSKTQLALAMPARALHDIRENKLDYTPGRRLCLLDSGAITQPVEPKDEDCPRWLSVTWARGARKGLKVVALYTAQ